MASKTILGGLGAIGLLTVAASADFTIDYVADAGGNNPNGPSGLSAAATFSITGNQLTILLQNTSTGAPAGAEASDSLLTSIAFSFGGGVSIVSGDSAIIAAGSTGLGAWSDRSAGDSVAEQWAWTNNAGGDFLAAFDQVISTSSGFGDGDYFDFNGAANPSLGGPFGGIAANPLTVPLPADQAAVSDAILFSLTLSESISEAALFTVAENGAVEFGSDFQYMTVPAPAAVALLALAGVTRRRRRG